MFVRLRLRYFEGLLSHQSPVIFSIGFLDRSDRNLRVLPRHAFRKFPKVCVRSGEKLLLWKPFSKATFPKCIRVDETRKRKLIKTETFENLKRSSHRGIKNS